MDYEEDYWHEYEQRDSTDMGKALTGARVRFVEKYMAASGTTDIGIGAGAYVKAARAFGFDVNPKANAWLTARGDFIDPYKQRVEAITCWDSIEHIPEPDKLLAKVATWVFVSLPIFEGPDHAMRSRHYKPGEHIWYFTNQGFIDYMARNGFECVEVNLQETILGREGIYTYAFRRVK